MTDTLQIAQRISRHVVIWHEKPSRGKPNDTMVRIPAAQNYTLCLRPDPSATSVHRGSQNFIYPAAAKLTDKLLTRHASSLRQGARVIELGCGLGLPGMVCAALGSHVMLTDMMEVIPAIEQRIALNFPRHGAGSSGSVRAAALHWDRDSAQRLVAQEGLFDFVLSSDCIYAPLYGLESSESLAQVMHTLCGPSTIALISVHYRPEEGGESDGTMEFMAALGQYLDVTLLEAGCTGFNSDIVMVIEAKLSSACGVGKRSATGTESDEYRSKARRVHCQAEEYVAT